MLVTGIHLSASSGTCGWLDPGHKARDDKYQQSSVLRSGFGEDVVASYVKLRQAEWNEYAGQLTDWERRTTLDC